MKSLPLLLSIGILLAGCSAKEEKNISKESFHKVQSEENATSNQNIKEVKSKISTKEETKTQEAPSPKITDPKTLVEQKLHTFTPDSSVFELNLTENAIPEILSIQYDATNSLVSIEQYNESTAKWIKVYHSEIEHYQGRQLMEILNIVDTTDGFQQVAVGYQNPSGGYMNFMIFGKDQPEKVSIVQDKMKTSYPNASLEIVNNNWVLKSDGKEVERYPF